MTKQTQTSIEDLKSVLVYDEITGKFYWSKTQNSRSIQGKEAGTLHRTGYIVIRYKGKAYSAHRLAWAFIKAHWPKRNIDHIDGDRKNNRFNNLREASHSENLYNLKLSSKNTSGMKGVHWSKANKKWKVQIKKEYKTYFGGYFFDVEEAKKSAKFLRRKLHGDFYEDGRRLS
jgi:hypothetical protein